MSKAAGVKRLFLFHHDPVQDDAAIRRKEQRARDLFPATDAAREGMTIDIA